MNKRSLIYLLALVLAGQFIEGAPGAPVYPGQGDTFPFAPAAGQTGSTALAGDDPSIVGWASGFRDINYGDFVDSQFRTPVRALGPSVLNVFDIVALGRGGEITLTFTNPIRDGVGADFAVFENGFGAFLELAWVEVSTDGVHYVRFPNFSFTLSTGGGAVDPTFIYGYASKYTLGWGTPFDLGQLQLAYDAVIEGTDSFSEDYRNELIENFEHPGFDLNDIRFVRLIDIIGDGSALDAEGFQIYEPFPTSGSAGFDLEAIAVLNQVESRGDLQSISFPEIEDQLFQSNSLLLNAISSSGLTVSFEVLDGPATVEGNVLTFTGRGQVSLRAVQPGDATYAPATPVAQDFVIADAFQHIYFEPVANQLVNTPVALNIHTSSGLTPQIDVISGPLTAIINSSNLTLNSLSAGTVTLRARQIGGTQDGIFYAPAVNVLMTVEIVNAGSVDAPVSFGDWQAANSVSGSGTKDSDLDGATDFEEFVGGTNPNDASERPVYSLERAADGEGFILEIQVSRLASVRVGVEGRGDLSNSPGWGELVPEIEDIEIPEGDTRVRKMRLRVPTIGDEQFWRFNLEEN